MERRYLFLYSGNIIYVPVEAGVVPGSGLGTLRRVSGYVILFFIPRVSIISDINRLNAL